MSLRAKLVVSLLLLGLLYASPVQAGEPTVAEVSKELICQCGCNMVLSNCNHLDCASRDSMMASIGQKIAQGKSKAEIIQSFVQQYEEQVLAAPTKRGFNLTAWVLPFVALVVGGGVIYALLRSWLRQGRRPRPETPAAEEEDTEYRLRLERELKEFTERELG